jgi:hypothetical protein
LSGLRPAGNTCGTATGWTFVTHADLGRYVHAVLDGFAALPGTPSRPSRRDRRVARELHDRGIPLTAVRAAFLLAAARREFRSEATRLAPVRTLHYFVPVVDEILELPLESGYAEHLERKLRPLLKRRCAFLESG